MIISLGERFEVFSNNKRKGFKKGIHKRKVERTINFEKYFHEWMNENTENFKYKPIRSGNDCYKFEGINERISICYSGFCEVCVFISPDLSNNECEDSMNLSYIDFTYPRYNTETKKYYCRECQEFNRAKYFDTEKELYIDEVFQYILKKVNEDFENQLLLIYLEKEDGAEKYRILHHQFRGEKEIEKYLNEKDDSKRNRDCKHEYMHKIEKIVV